MAKLLITYTKSAIGYSKDQKATVRSLGLRKLNSIAIQADTPAIRGMIFKVRHLVKVEEVSDTTTKPRHVTVRPIVRPASEAQATQPAPTLAAPARATAVAKEPVAKPVIEEIAEPVAAEPEAEEIAEEAVAEPVAEEIAEEVVAEPVAEEIAEPVAVEPAAADDLTVIEGIGPKIADVLRAAGIDTFAQLAATDSASLTEILQAAELRLAAPDTWPEQAALAAAGSWEELQQLQDRLKGGRREE
jgi:ribosomal protein L30